MTTISPLDPTQRQSFINQFTSQAKTKGTTMEQEMYDYAKANNISNEGVDTYMGYSPGTAQKWVDQNIKPMGPSQNPVATFPGAENHKGPVYDSPSQNPIATFPAKTGGLMNSSPARTLLPESERVSIIGDANRQALAGNIPINDVFRQMIKSNNLSNEEADTMMGWAPGTAAGLGGTSSGVIGGSANSSGAGGSGSTVAPLSEAERANWTARFDNQAKESGKSVGQVMYEYAQQHGLSNADVDRYMGYAPGTAQAWVDANIGAGGGGNPPPDGSAKPFTTLTTTPEQTVAGQMQGLMDPNNPFIQQARTRARVSGNARGLLNSSLIESAADSAAYDAALPIAQADAAQFGRAAEFNASTANQFAMADKAQAFDLEKMDRQAAITLSQMSAEQQNIVARLAAQQGYNLETINANQVNDLAKFAAQVEAQNQQAEAKYGYDRGLVEIQKASNLEIASLESQYRLQTQGSTSATSIMNQLSAMIARAMDNKDTTTEAKQAQIDYYLSTSNAALKLVGQFAGDVDLSTALSDILGAAP